MTFFNVIAYRSNGYESCRGHVVDSTDSDCTIFNSTSLAETADHIAKLRFSEIDASRATNTWDISIIINGICVEDAIESNWYNYDDNDYDTSCCILGELVTAATLSLLNVTQEHIQAEALAAEAKIKADAEAEQLRIAQSKAKIIADYKKLMENEQ